MNGKLTQVQIDELREILNTRYRELKLELRAEKPEPLSVESESQGYEEAYLSGIGQQVEKGVEAQHRVEAKRIEAAFKRMEDGSYGICEDCDGPIALARLRAFPAARLCIECKETYEQEQRAKS